jgi:hypothetical protein
VRGVEYGLVLHAQRRQVVDIEEATVVDVVGCNPPVGQPEGLRLEQLMQRIEAHGIAGSARQAADRLVERGGHPGVRGGELGQRPLVRFLVAIALGNLLRGGAAPVRQRAEQAAQLLQLRIALQRQHGIEDARVGARIERQAMFVIMDREGAERALELQLELAALEHGSVGLRQHRHQHLVGERRIHRIPVDVEIVRVDGGLPALEDIHPPRIVGSHDTNVIRHDIEDMAHGVRTQLRHQQLEILAAADFRIEGVVIDDVIAMGAAGARAEIG